MSKLTPSQYISSQNIDAEYDDLYAIAEAHKDVIKSLLIKISKLEGFMIAVANLTNCSASIDGDNKDIIKGLNLIIEQNKKLKVKT